MNRKKEIISLLSREQKFKKVFLQLGNQRNIPHDIILLIYNLLRYQSQKEIKSIQDYHITNLYQVTLLGELNINIHSDEFKSKLPINRGPEWGIKHVSHPDAIFRLLHEDGSAEAMDNSRPEAFHRLMLAGWARGRFNISKHINIIGEKDYLYERDYDNNKYKLATLKTKLNYINNSQFFLEDYDEYINNNKPNNYSIVINIYGEGTVFWTNQFNYYNNYY